MAWIVTTDVDGSPPDTSRIYTLSPEALKELSGDGVIKPLEMAKRVGDLAITGRHLRD